MTTRGESGGYTRRRLFGDAAKVIAGGLAGGLICELMEPDRPNFVPLQPESGEALSNIVVAWLPKSVAYWSPRILSYSKQYNIDPNLPAIITTIESGGYPMANSGEAKGLMQLTDARAKDVSQKYLLKPRSSYDLFDPDTSIEFGVANIRHLIDEYGSAAQGPSWDATVALVSAGYYGGEGAADLYQAKGLAGMSDQGTYNYIRYATTMWRERHDNKSFAYNYWYYTGNGQALVEQADGYFQQHGVNI